MIRNASGGEIALAKRFFKQLSEACEVCQPVLTKHQEFAFKKPTEELPMPGVHGLEINIVFNRSEAMKTFLPDASFGLMCGAPKLFVALAANPAFSAILEKTVEELEPDQDFDPFVQMRWVGMFGREMSLLQSNLEEIGIPDGSKELACHQALGKSKTLLHQFGQGIPKIVREDEESVIRFRRDTLG